MIALPPYAAIHLNEVGLTWCRSVSEFHYSMIRPARDCSRHEERPTRLHGEHTFHGFAPSPGPEARGPVRDNSQGLARRIRLFQGHHFGAVAIHGSLLGGGPFHERQRRAHVAECSEVTNAFSFLLSAFCFQPRES